jgi:hypothetical protein
LQCVLRHGPCRSIGVHSRATSGCSAREHPDTLTSVNNLAGCLVALGDAAGAVPLCQRALDGREQREQSGRMPAGAGRCGRGLAALSACTRGLRAGARQPSLHYCAGLFHRSGIICRARHPRSASRCNCR